MLKSPSENKNKAEETLSQGWESYYLPVFIQIFAAMRLKLTLPITLIIALLFTGSKAIAQPLRLTQNAQISLLTCAAGQAMYYAFGHSALRVQDSTLGLDVVYNYGTFDFNRPDFYLNFAKGTPIYSLSRVSFDSFLWTYAQEERWVREQVFALNQEEKQQLFAFLETNYLPQNRDYLYDPLFNNCSSIIATILKEQLGEALVFDGSYLNQPYTFRELIHQHVPLNSWGGLVIDVLFGTTTDREATVQEHLFLPYYTMQQMRHTTKEGKPLVKQETLLLDYKERPYRTAFLGSPLFWFTLLLLITGIVTYRNLRRRHRSRGLDFFLFFITGLPGIGLLLLWVASSHTVTLTNFDLLWAFPLNALVAFCLLRPGKLPKWLHYYVAGVLVLLALLLFLWMAKLQSFSLILLPLLLTLALRYGYLLTRAKP